MKTQDLLIIGAIAAGGYLLYKSFRGQNITSNDDLGGYPSGIMPGFNQGEIFAPKTQTTQPISTDFQKAIFTPTTEGAADRFLIAPGSGGGGVYDRYAQQSIRKEYANTRAIFGTPGISGSAAPRGSGGNTATPAIKKLFKEGLNPQSVQI